MTLLAAEAAALLGEVAAGAERLRGGDLSEVLRLRLASGRSVVAKIGEGAIAEARMLAAILAAGAPAPAPLAVVERLLVMEDLGPEDDGSGEGLGAGSRLGSGPGPGSDAVWAELGAIVAGLHATTGPDYGWPEDHRFGPVAIPNGPAADWPAFWAERRLLAAPEALPPDLARRVERLAARLGDLLPARPRPALLHGDLWPGNVLVRAGRVRGLIDPACHYGDAEVDLAMLTLFGAPAPAFRQAYGPAAPGLAERRPVYQLWPALVHLRLFGAGYRGLVERLLAQAGA